MRVLESDFVTEPVAYMDRAKIRKGPTRYPVYIDVRGKSLSSYDVHFALVSAAARVNGSELSLRTVQNFISSAINFLNGLPPEEMRKKIFAAGFDPDSILRVQRWGRTPYYSPELVAFALQLEEFEVLSPSSVL